MESQVFGSSIGGLLDFELGKIEFETRIEKFSIKIQYFSLKININEKIYNKSLYIWSRDRHGTGVSGLNYFCPRDSSPCNFSVPVRGTPIEIYLTRREKLPFSKLCPRKYYS